MKTKCLLVDDEPLAIALLENHLEQLEHFEVAGSCSNAIKAAEFLRTNAVDLLFLDIKMPRISGLDFLKTLRNPPPVIITTAYREYALDGYDLDIVDYLLKPITFDRFFKAIDRYQRLYARLLAPVASSQEDVVQLKSGNKIYKLPATDILYMESLKDYVVVHGKEQKISIKCKISELETALSGKDFLRVHRSFIVNLRKITAFTPYDLELGAIEIPIGASYKEYVFKKLKS